jgi:hypothetical protein
VIERKTWGQRRSRRWRRSTALAVGLVAVAVALAACGTGGGSSSGPGGAPGGGAGDRGTAQPPLLPTGPAGANAPAPSNCTQQVNDSPGLRQALGSAGPGDTICVSGALTDVRMTIDRGGSADSPIIVRGDGRTATRGIAVEADNVIVDGFVADRPEAPGVVLKGSNITLRNTTINSPRGGDGDGIRFWGSNIKIVHNTITDTSNATGAHADCMQTYATDEDNPASQDILIDSNRCEKIDNNCLIAEGPNSSAGDGSGEGETRNFTFSNNFCDNRAAQAVLADDVRNMTITNNEIVGDINHAFAFQNESTNGVVSGNRVSSVQYEVGMDDSSEGSYHGPRPGGAP